MGDIRVHNHRIVLSRRQQYPSILRSPENYQQIRSYVYGVYQKSILPMPHEPILVNRHEMYN